MNTHTTQRPTAEDVRPVLEALKTQQRAHWDLGPVPTVLEDWDWTGGQPVTAIIWEEGPYDWTYLFPYGGIEEEYGSTLKDVSEMIPEGLYVEPVTSWAVAIYWEN